MSHRRFETPSRARVQKFWEIRRIENGLGMHRRWGLSNGENVRYKLDRFETEHEADNVERYLIAKRRRNGYLEVRIH